MGNVTGSHHEYGKDERFLSGRKQPLEIKEPEFIFNSVKLPVFSNSIFSNRFHLVVDFHLAHTEINSEQIRVGV